MNVNTSPMLAPSLERSRSASAERASRRRRYPARMPEQFAGESRKIRRAAAMAGGYTGRVEAEKTTVPGVPSVPLVGAIGWLTWREDRRLLASDGVTRRCRCRLEREHSSARCG